MTDILDRLAERQDTYYGSQHDELRRVLGEAAGEIQRLREVLDSAGVVMDGTNNTVMAYYYQPSQRVVMPLKQWHEARKKCAAVVGWAKCVAADFSGDFGHDLTGHVAHAESWRIKGLLKSVRALEQNTEESDDNDYR